MENYRTTDERSRASLSLIFQLNVKWSASEKSRLEFLIDSISLSDFARI